MINRVIAILTSRIAPMVYVMMFVSVIIGFSFFTDSDIVQHGESVLFANGALINIHLWGGLLFATSTTAFIGFITKNSWAIRIGALGSFSLWLLASIDLTMGQHWYVLLVLGMFHMVFQMYVYLAESLGVLQRTSIR